MVHGTREYVRLAGAAGALAAGGEDLYARRFEDVEDRPPGWHGAGDPGNGEFDLEGPRQQGFAGVLGGEPLHVQRARGRSAQCFSTASSSGAGPQQ